VSVSREYRRERLLAEVIRHGVLPDIIAMQEVDHYDDW
jgi:mRNA deadenylase 3'-5' endonuclease subunit Ccr4